MTLKVNVSLPQFKASGWFDSDIKILEFPFNSKAKFKLTAGDITTQFTVFGVFEDDGKHFVVKSYNFIPTVRNFKIEMKGLGPDKQLSKI